MPGHPDILDEKEPLKGSLAGSLLLHGGLVALVAAYSFLGLGKTEHWGEADSLAGGAVAITPVSSIPIVSRQGKVNPVANDTESQIPEAPAEKTKPQAKKEPEDAIQWKSKKDIRKAAEDLERQHKYKSSDPKPNQVFTKGGQALTSPMMSMNSGGGVGSGQGSPFGARLGWYEKLLRDKVSKNWRSEEVDSRLQTAPPAVVTFTLMRDGSVRNIRHSGSSGNFTLDQTTLRAIEVSAPFPPLPREFECDSANSEFWFRLQR